MSTATTSGIALTDSPNGCVFRVVRVEAECEDAARLKAMGVCVGRRLSLVQTGDPLIVCVVGSRLGMSRRLAATVFVEAECCPDDEPTD